MWVQCSVWLEIVGDTNLLRDLLPGISEVRGVSVCALDETLKVASEAILQAVELDDHCLARRFEIDHQLVAVIHGRRVGAELVTVQAHLVGSYTENTNPHAGWNLDQTELLHDFEPTRPTTDPM